MIRALLVILALSQQAVAQTYHAISIELTEQERLTAISALAALPSGTIRKDQVADKIMAPHVELTLPEVIILGLALSRYDTLESLALMRRISASR